MKSTKTRNLHTLRAPIALLIAGGLALLTLMPSGCGGGKSASAPSTPAGETRAGELRISVPPLPASQTRLLPDLAPYIKVEILDAAGEDKKNLIPVALFEDRDENGKQIIGARVKPDADSNLVPAGDVLFDVLDRSQRTSRSYQYLPLKNLILRVGVYRENPYQNTNATTNPALAKTEVSFVPKRKTLDGSGGKQSLELTLATSIQTLEINGPDVAEADVKQKPSVSYTVNARLDNAIVLVSTDAALKPANVDWKAEIIQNTARESDAASLTTDGSAQPQSLNGQDTPPVTQGLNATLLNKSRVERRLRLTVTDRETGKQAVKEILLRPRPSGINLKLTNPPFGTRSVRFTFTPTQFGSAPFGVVVPFTEATKSATNTLQLAPDAYAVTARPFATDDAVAGAELTTEEVPVYTSAAPWDALPGLFNTPIAEKEARLSDRPAIPLSLYVVSGQKYKNNGAGPGLEPLAEKQISEVELVAGQRDYQLEMRVNAVALSNAGFKIQPPPPTAPLVSPIAVAAPISGGANTRYLLRLNDQERDSAAGGPVFTVFEAERNNSKTFTTTIKANLGGAAKVKVN